MAYYEVFRRVNDFTNGILLIRGEIVETEDDLWVKRLGTALKPKSFVPPNTTVKSVIGTKEGKSTTEQVVKPAEEKPSVRRRGVLNSVEDKMVSADDSDMK